MRKARTALALVLAVLVATVGLQGSADAKKKRVTFYSGGILVSDATTLSVRPFNSTGKTIAVTVTVLQFANNAAATVVGSQTQAVPARTIRAFNFSDPGGIGNCECQVRMIARKPGIVPSLYYVPAGETFTESIPSGSWLKKSKKKVFTSGDILVQDATTLRAKAFNTTGRSVSVSATAIRFPNVVVGTVTETLLPGEVDHLDFVDAGGAGNCECVVTIRSRSKGIVPSIQYDPAGAGFAVNDVAAGEFS